MARDGGGARRTHKVADKEEHEIDTRGGAGRGVDVSILHKETIFENLGPGRDEREARAIEMMRGAAATVEQPGTAEEQRTGTD